MSMILAEEIIEFIVDKLDRELDVDLNARRDFLEILKEGDLKKLKPIIRFSCENTLKNVSYDTTDEDGLYQEIVDVLKRRFAEEM